jgi:hypothetical protein
MEEFRPLWIPWYQAGKTRPENEGLDDLIEAPDKRKSLSGRGILGKLAQDRPFDITAGGHTDEYCCAMKRLMLAATLLTGLLSDSKASAADVNDLKTLSIYEFSSDDAKWILETPPLKTLKEEGRIAFTSHDILSLKTIGSAISDVVHFQIVFSATGRRKFTKFIESSSSPQLFIVINESEVMTGVRACFGCDTIDGSLPRATFQRVVNYLNRNE